MTLGQINSEIRLQRKLARPLAKSPSNACPRSCAMSGPAPCWERNSYRTPDPSFNGL